jgi:hypothetical protein
MPASNYDDRVMNDLRKRLWKTAFDFGEEMHEQGDALSGLELLMALHQMVEETHHHWIEDNKLWNDILG